MDPHVTPEFHLANVITAVVVSVVWISGFSLVAEPNRRTINAILVAGASGAYLNGGMGGWEFVFAIAVLFCAYRGLQQYAFVGIGWLLHTGWDVVHHFIGHPIIGWLPTSSGECAITDALLAIWFFIGAPSVWTFVRNRFAQASA